MLIILVEKCLGVAKHFYAQYPYVETPSSHQAFLHQSPYAETLSGC
jgi:hypothetical protein